MKHLKLRAMLGLLLVIVAVIWEIEWVWGVIFLAWVIPDLIARETHFFEQVTRADNPVLYWSIMVTWIILSVYLLVSPFLHTLPIVEI